MALLQVSWRFPVFRRRDIIGRARSEARNLSIPVLNSMRRWLIILLLIVYPFQVALALADECCVTTPGGLTHHGVAEQAGGSLLAAPMLVVDDPASALADPHCPACSFGHQLYLPSLAVAVPIGHQQTAHIANYSLPLDSPPAARLERPKWPAAAR